ncbi:MAG: head-tail adaptor protein [Pseudomonadota bacterium]
MERPHFDTPLLLQAPTQTVDAGGGVAVTWETLGSVWADISPVSAREIVSGLREGARISHRITVRSAAIGSPRRPRPEQRLRAGERIFAIRAVVPSGSQGRYLTCWAEEGPFS